jgi:hypothetical protein
MGRDFYQKPPGSQPKYRQADGQIVNFKPSPDAKPIGSGVKSHPGKAGSTGPSSGGSGTGVYQDAILRSRNKDNPEQPSTANSRTGSGQIKRMLRYPLSREAPYLATIRFIPVKQASTVDDVVNKLSGLSQQVIENPDEEFVDDTEFDSRDPSVEARAEATATVTSTGPRNRTRTNVGAVNQSKKKENFRAREGSYGASALEVQGFEGKNGSTQPAATSTAIPTPVPGVGGAVLYLPQAIQITDGVQVGPIDLGVVGAGALSVLQKGGDVYDVVGSAIKNSDISSILSSFVNPDLGKAAGALTVQRAAAKVSNVLGGAVGLATRVTVNPHTRSLFRSVNLREFAFQFKMIATSRAEAEEIKSIIRFFRMELYPDVLQVRGLPLAYLFPNPFEIKIQYADEDMPGMKIKPSYLRNFTATYNPTGMGMHDDGNFAEVDIAMSFVEESTLSRKDVEQGGY